MKISKVFENKIDFEIIEDGLIELIDSGFEIENYRSGKFDSLKRNFAASNNPASRRVPRFNREAVSFTLTKKISNYLSLEETNKNYSDPCRVIKLFANRYKCEPYFIIGFKNDDDYGENYYRESDVKKLQIHVVIVLNSNS